MYRTIRSSLAIASAALLVLAVASCGSDDTAAPAQPATGERIRLAMLLPPRAGLTPLSDDAFKLSRWSTAETLVVLDAEGDLQPALATAWSAVDDRTWRFELRDGVVFHDGTDLTVEAVVGALTKAAAAAPAPRILDGVDLTAEPDPAAPEDAVLVRVATADPLLPQRLSSPQLSILAPSAYLPDGTVTPVGTGTGPFELVSVEGTTSARLDRFDGYWGTVAAAAGIDVDFVPDGTARAAALRTGTADIVEAVPVAQAPLLDQALVHEVPMPRTNTLYLNNERGAFSDAGLRAAAREAIRRDVLVSNVYEGRADASVGLLGPALAWTANRPARAETAATDPAGTAITLATYTDRPELPEVAVQLQQQLEAAGFVVEQVVREYAQIETDALGGVFDAFILSRATVLDSGDPVAYLTSDFSCEGGFNLSRFCNAEVDAALAAAAATPAGAPRRAAILEAERLILEADAAIPLLHERVIQGEAAGVRGAARDPRERVLITVETVVER